MTDRVRLSDSQRRILSEFYTVEPTKVIFDKPQRDSIWSDFKTSKQVPRLDLERKCPAMLNEMRRAISSGNNVQSAVFSECVYAQTLANMLALDQFLVVEAAPVTLSAETLGLISSCGLKARYVYQMADEGRALVQAGGFGGVDAALVSVSDGGAFAIEFKEPGAKTSEPDLPKYGEDGYLKDSPDFISKYPQFKTMIEEQLSKQLNFFERAGTNVHDFSVQSIDVAVSENYATTKYADVICVEDQRGYLTMLPANQIARWSDTRGEIRPAGRNKFAVWTPLALKQFIIEAGGVVVGQKVRLPLRKMATASARGGGGAVNRYKINPLFFVYAEHVHLEGSDALFDLDKVKQLRPTIAAHMFFRNLNVNEVHKYYSEEF